MLDHAQGNNFKGKPLGHVLQQVERQYFAWALTETGGNKRQAALLAGVSYPTFMRKLANMDIKVDFHVE